MVFGLFCPVGLETKLFLLEGSTLSQGHATTPTSSDVRFSNRPFEVKRFQTTHKLSRPITPSLPPEAVVKQRLRSGALDHASSYLRALGEARRERACMDAPLWRESPVGTGSG